MTPVYSFSRFFYNRGFTIEFGTQYASIWEVAKTLAASQTWGGARRLAFFENKKGIFSLFIAKSLGHVPSVPPGPYVYGE